MPKATLTKRLEFCSSHRYHNPNWDDAKNQEVFGACNNVNTHGHNYLLEVTLCGEIDPVTGMIINLYDLKLYLWEVLKEFDHKNLNLDTPYFHDRIPTSENLAWTLWELLAKHPQLPALERIRLYEDDTLYAEVIQKILFSLLHRKRPLLLVADINSQPCISWNKGSPRGISTNCGCPSKASFLTILDRLSASRY